MPEAVTSGLGGIAASLSLPLPPPSLCTPARARHESAFSDRFGTAEAVPVPPSRARTAYKSAFSDRFGIRVALLCGAGKPTARTERKGGDDRAGTRARCFETPSASLAAAERESGALPPRCRSRVPTREGEKEKPYSLAFPIPAFSISKLEFALPSKWMGREL